MKHFLVQTYTMQCYRYLQIQELGWDGGKCYENIVPNSLKHYKHCKTIKAVKDEIILN